MIDSILHKLLLTTAAHDLGIVPLDDVRDDVNRTLSTMPLDEARAMRRKFRKLWRKFCRNSDKALSVEYCDQMEMGSPKPSRRARTTRKREVKRRILVDVVAPLMKAASSSAKEG